MQVDRYKLSPQQDRQLQQVQRLQAMLPQLLKATYEKELVRLTNDKLSYELEELFSGRDVVPYEELAKSEISYYQIKKAVEEAKIVVNYKVRSRETRQYKTIIKPALSDEDLKLALQQLPRNAVRQQQLISFFINHHRPIEQNELYQHLQTNRSNIKALIDKSILTEEKVEVYRNPYNDDQFQQTSNLVLTDEQQVALKPINEKIEKEH